MLDQHFAPLAGLHRGRGGEDTLEVAIFTDQLRGSLRPDAWHPRHVIHGVADQRLRLDHLLRRHAELFHHLGWPDRLLLHRVEHIHARPDQLHQVLVGGDDGGPPAHFSYGAGVGGDKVIGLPIRQLDCRHPESGGGLAHDGELRAQLFGRFRPLGLVALVEPIAERVAPCIEDDGNVGSDMLAKQLREHI